VTPETVVRVPMMKQQDQFYYLLDRNLSCKVVGVPYEGNATAFFILPREGEMEQVENGLKEKTLKKWLRMPMKRYSSHFSGASLLRHTHRATQHLAQDLPPSPEASCEVPAPGPESASWREQDRKLGFLVGPSEYAVTAGDSSGPSPEPDGFHSKQ